MPAKPKPTAKKAAPAKLPLPKQARSRPSLALWLSSDPDRVANLKRIFADPDFVAACAYVEGIMDVTPDDLIGAKAALPEVIVRKAAMAAGVRAFVATITSLPNFRKQQAADVPEPWGHIQAPIR